ncbi:hypothetical protein D3C76_829110 [compost metagenome]
MGQQSVIEYPGIDRTVEARSDVQQATVCVQTGAGSVAKQKLLGFPGPPQEALHDLGAERHGKLDGLPGD